MRRPTKGPGFPGSPDSTEILAPLGSVGGASPHLRSELFMYVPDMAMSAARAGEARIAALTNIASGIKRLRISLLLVVVGGQRHDSAIAPVSRKPAPRLTA